MEQTLKVKEARKAHSSSSRCYHKDVANNTPTSSNSECMSKMLIN